MIRKGLLAIVIGFIGLIGVTLGSCAGGGGKKTLETALSAPPKAVPAAAAFNEEGIKLFYARQWDADKVKFEADERPRQRDQPVLHQPRRQLPSRRDEVLLLRQGRRRHGRRRQ